LRESLEYVVATYLDGDLSRVTTSPSFRNRSFILQSGQEVKGGAMLRAVARLEHPDLNTVEAINATEGGIAVQLIKEKYLPELHAAQNWSGTFERLQETLAYVVDEYLDGDANRVRTSRSFIGRVFIMPSGQNVKGVSLLRAVAMRERQTWNTMSRGEAARIAREVYLAKYHDARDWGSSFDKLTQTLRYVVEEYLNGDVDGIGVSETFLRAKYLLPSDQRISGQQLLFAVAKLERRDRSASATYNEYGPAQIARIAREKYLFELDQTPESFVQAMKMIMGDDGDENGGDA